MFTLTDNAFLVRIGRRRNLLLVLRGHVTEESRWLRVLRLRNVINPSTVQTETVKNCKRFSLEY